MLYNGRSVERVTRRFARETRRARRALSRRRRGSRPASSPPRTGAPVSRSSAVRARAARSGSTGGRAPRLRARTRPPRRLLCGSHREPAPHDRPRERPPALVVRHGEHGAGMALRDRPALDEAEHVVRELEQPDTVRHRRLRAADALCDLAQREPELVHEHRAGARLLDRREILARHVLDEREDERIAVVASPGRAPAPWRARRPWPLASGARRRSARTSRPEAGGRRSAGRHPAPGRTPSGPPCASGSNLRRGWRALARMAPTGSWASSVARQARRRAAPRARGRGLSG